MVNYKLNLKQNLNVLRYKTIKTKAKITRIQEKQNQIKTKYFKNNKLHLE